MDRKSQAAMEFLMTYGWALLIMFIVISAFALFGIANPDIFIPDRLNLPTGFVAYTHAGYSDGLKLMIGNAKGVVLNDVEVSVLDCDTSKMGEKYAWTLPPGEFDTYAIFCNLPPGRLKSDVIIKYTTKGGLVKREKGEIITHIQETPGATEHSCKNIVAVDACDNSLNDEIFGQDFVRKNCCCLYDLCLDSGECTGLNKDQQCAD